MDMDQFFIWDVFLVTQKNGQNRMDKADKKCVDFLQTPDKPLGTFSHLHQKREESQCGGLRSTCSKFRMTVVQTNPLSC